MKYILKTALGVLIGTIISTSSITILAHTDTPSPTPEPVIQEAISNTEEKRNTTDKEIQPTNTQETVENKINEPAMVMENKITDIYPRQRIITVVLLGSIFLYRLKKLRKERSKQTTDRGFLSNIGKFSTKEIIIKILSYIALGYLIYIFAHHGLGALQQSTAFTNLIRNSFNTTRNIELSYNMASTLLIIIGIIDMIIISLLLVYRKVFVVTYAGLRPIVPTLMGVTIMGNVDSHSIQEIAFPIIAMLIIFWSSKR